MSTANPPAVADPKPAARDKNDIIQDSVRRIFDLGERERNTKPGVYPEGPLQYYQPRLDYNSDAKQFDAFLKDFMIQANAAGVPQAEQTRIQASLKTAMEYQINQWAAGIVDNKQWTEAFDKAKTVIADVAAKEPDATKKTQISDLQKNLDDANKKEFETAQNNAARVLDLEMRAIQQRHNEARIGAVGSKNASIRRVDKAVEMEGLDINAQNANNPTLQLAQYKKMDKGFWTDGKSQVWVDENGVRPSPPRVPGTNAWKRDYAFAFDHAILKSGIEKPIKLNYGTNDPVTFDSVVALIKMATERGLKIDDENSQNFQKVIAEMRTPVSITAKSLGKETAQTYIYALLEENKVKHQQVLDQTKAQTQAILDKAQAGFKAPDTLLKKAEDIHQTVVVSNPHDAKTLDVLMKAKDDIDKLLPAVRAEERNKDLIDELAKASSDIQTKALAMKQHFDSESKKSPNDTALKDTANKSANLHDEVTGNNNKTKWPSGDKILAMSKQIDDLVNASAPAGGLGAGAAVGSPPPNLSSGPGAGP